MRVMNFFSKDCAKLLEKSTNEQPSNQSIRPQKFALTVALGAGQAIWGSEIFFLIFLVDEEIACASKLSLKAWKCRDTQFCNAHTRITVSNAIYYPDHRDQAIGENKTFFLPKTLRHIGTRTQISQILYRNNDISYRIENWLHSFWCSNPPFMCQGLHSTSPISLSLVHIKYVEMIASGSRLSYLTLWNSH